MTRDPDPRWACTPHSNFASNRGKNGHGFACKNQPVFARLFFAFLDEKKAKSRSEKRHGGSLKMRFDCVDEKTGFLASSEGLPTQSSMLLHTPANDQEKKPW